MRFDFGSHVGFKALRLPPERSYDSFSPVISFVQLSSPFISLALSLARCRGDQVRAASEPLIEVVPIEDLHPGVYDRLIVKRLLYQLPQLWCTVLYDDDSQVGTLPESVRDVGRDVFEKLVRIVVRWKSVLSAGQTALF